LQVHICNNFPFRRRSAHYLKHSCHHLRNSSTLDRGIFDYSGSNWRKEHPKGDTLPEALGIPCISFHKAVRGRELGLRGGRVAQLVQCLTMDLDDRGLRFPTERNFPLPSASRQSLWDPTWGTPLGAPRRGNAIGGPPSGDCHRGPPRGVSQGGGDPKGIPNGGPPWGVRQGGPPRRAHRVESSEVRPLSGVQRVGSPE
jgi:hypothetical protein